MTNANANFQWKCQPEAEAFLLGIVDEAKTKNAFIATLSHDLLANTSTRLFDWLDHVSIGNSSTYEEALESTGFVADITTSTYRVFHHPGAQLPRVVVYDHDQPVAGLAVSVDSISDFLQVRGMGGWIEGSPLSGYRRCCMSTDNGISLFAVERRGVLGMEPTYYEETYASKYIEAAELWKTRPRDLVDVDEGMERTLSIAAEIINLVGQDTAAWIILECERAYWQARNTAAQIQKNRQDRMGMGWANHDHHTFRSSRHLFVKLVRLFEMLGFHCRERFYAGEEAGWGAQVMENPRCRLVLFLDVDLHPEEVAVDFSHHPLSSLDHLGTIGLWCALHGDSILKSGMHHLEAQFMFAELTNDLAASGIAMMDPFSSFPYLKQAFTRGEVWHVDSKRVQALVASGHITPEEAKKFHSYGAVGSHMENLQRREGYKGFNQKNVSFIIKKTDPRRLVK